MRSSRSSRVIISIKVGMLAVSEQFELPPSWFPTGYGPRTPFALTILVHIRFFTTTARRLSPLPRPRVIRLLSSAQFLCLVAHTLHDSPRFSRLCFPCPNRAPVCVPDLRLVADVVRIVLRTSSGIEFCCVVEVSTVLQISTVVCFRIRFRVLA